jgi:hypothetical protein
MMAYRRIAWLGTFLVALGVLVPSTATAAARESQERAAKKACMTGDAAKGVEILADLFIDTGDLTYVFNQGRCWEQNSRYEAAIARFREYLIKGTNLSSEAKAEAERHIALCQSFLGKVEPTPAPAAVAAPVPPPAATAAPAPPLAVPPIEQRPVPPATSDGSGLRLAGMVTAAGVALNLKVNSMAGDLEKPYSYSRGTEGSRKDYQTMGWVSYGVGAACVASGTILYAIGWHRGRSANVAVAVSPMWTPGGSSLALTGAF